MLGFDSQGGLVETWKLQLAVRRKACEGRLYDLRERHGNVVLLRRRHPEMGPSWHKKADKLAWIRHLINRELDEIRFIRLMGRVGPIAGNALVLYVRNGVTNKVTKGPSIIDLIKREVEKYRSDDAPTDDIDVRSFANGLERALEIFYNPYRFLNDSERTAFTAAEEAADKIIENRAGNPREEKTSKPAKQSGPTLDQIRAKTADTNVVVRRKNG